MIIYQYRWSETQTHDTNTHFVIDVSDVHDKMDIITKIICHDPPQDILRDIVPIQRASSSYGADLLDKKHAYLAWPMCDAS